MMLQEGHILTTEVLRAHNCYPGLPSQAHLSAATAIALSIRVAIVESLQALADLMLTDADGSRHGIAPELTRVVLYNSMDEWLDGKWQPIAARLLRVVPFDKLEAMVLRCDAGRHQPQDAALVTPKLIQLVQELLRSHDTYAAANPSAVDANQHQLRACRQYQQTTVAAGLSGSSTPHSAIRQAVLTAEAAAEDADKDWWACIVFVERRTTARVLSRLINSLPGVRQRLRSSEFVGQTQMDEKVRSW